jgi:hypothetical protein
MAPNNYKYDENIENILPWSQSIKSCKNLVNTLNRVCKSSYYTKMSPKKVPIAATTAPHYISLERLWPRTQRLSDVWKLVNVSLAFMVRPRSHYGRMNRKPD